MEYILSSLFLVWLIGTYFWIVGDNPINWFRPNVWLVDTFGSSSKHIVYKDRKTNLKYVFYDNSKRKDCLLILSDDGKIIVPDNTDNTRLFTRYAFRWTNKKPKPKREIEIQELLASYRQE